MGSSGSCLGNYLTTGQFARENAPPMAKDAAVTYIAAQPADKRVLLEKLRTIVAATLPDAVPALKWGVAVYAVDGKNVCALAAFKDHVAINFLASPAVLADPKKKLEGGGKTQRMLKVRTASDIDAASIKRWLKAAAAKG